MGDKSYVGLEYKVCPVCCTKFDTGAILLDKRLKQSLEKETVTGWDLCKECGDLHKRGFIALVAVREDLKGGKANPDEVYREGVIVHLKREAAVRMIPELESVVDKPLIWCSKALCEQLIELEEDRVKAEGK